jgi:hypothetical protein
MSEIAHRKKDPGTVVLVSARIAGSGSRPRWTVLETLVYADGSPVAVLCGSPAAGWGPGGTLRPGAWWYGFVLAEDRRRV